MRLELVYSQYIFNHLNLQPKKNNDINASAQIELEQTLNEAIVCQTQKQLNWSVYLCMYVILIEYRIRECVRGVAGVAWATPIFLVLFQALKNPQALKPPGPQALKPTNPQTLKPESPQTL